MATPNPPSSIILPTAPAAWGAEHLDLIRRTICHPSMSPLEIALFLEQCRRTELDPLKGEAFCVPRRVKITVQGREDWVDRYTFQPAEAGMSSRAAKFPDFVGIRGAAFFEKDKMEVTETIDAESGEMKIAKIVHIYEPNKDRGPLRGAWALALRKGFSFSPEIVYLQEYIQRTAKGEITKQWQKPHTMILKCARSATWRRVFPEAFSGIYSREEVQLEHDTAEQERQASAPAPAAQPAKRADQVAQRVGAKLAEVRAQALPPATGGGTLTAPAPTRAAVAEAVVLVNPGRDAAIATARRLDQEEAKLGRKLTRDEEVKLLDQMKSGEIEGKEPPPVVEDEGEELPPPPEEQAIDAPRDPEANWPGSYGPDGRQPPADTAPATGPGQQPPDTSTTKLSFGPPNLRGKQLSTLTTDDLIAAAALAEDELAKATGKESWFEPVKRDLQAIEAELTKREQAQQ